MRRFIFALGLIMISSLSSCALVDLGLAYLGYTLILVIVVAASTFLFNIFQGMTESFGWSLVLTFIVALVAMAIIFRW